MKKKQLNNTFDFMCDGALLLQNAAKRKSNE